MKDKANHKTKWTLRKYADDQAFKEGRAFEENIIKGNVLLNDGINSLLTLLIGGGETPYDNIYSQIGVGDSSTAANANQADLQATTNKTYKGMESGYPSVSGQTVTFRSVFGGADANFDWNEFVVHNTDSELCLNRKVSAQGTKASGQTWTVDVEITIS